MPRSHQHLNHHKLVPLFKAMTTDLKHAVKELEHRPSVKEFKAELRHAESDVRAVVKEAAREVKSAAKEAAHEIKSVVKEAAHEVKDMLKSADAPLQFDATVQTDAAAAAGGSLLAHMYDTSEVSPMASATNAVESTPPSETPPVELTLIGLPTFETSMGPDHG